MSIKKILVTGGAGFIGANFIPYLLAKYPTYQIINLDKLTYAGNLQNLAEVMNHPQHHFVQGDITDTALLERLFKQYLITDVIHFAAESHVDRSIQAPMNFVHTNLLGTATLLEIARSQWMKGPNEYQSDYKNSLFLHVSTDEVYGSLPETGYFQETSAYAPNNPYSATKAGSDFLVRSYIKTYGFQAIITHSSNNYGPKQYPEKLVPVIIKKALACQPIPIHGTGQAIRDWLYVVDHCRGIDAAFHLGTYGEHYNFGGHCELTNLAIASLICQILDEIAPCPNLHSYQALITYVLDRPGNDQRYALDTHKAENLLNWRPLEALVSGLRKTISWYMNAIPN